MKITSYIRHTGTTIIKDHLSNRCGQELHESKVSFTWPKQIESIYRYLRLYEPNAKYLLDWNPLHEPSFGIWLEFTKTTIRLRSKTAHHLNKNDINILFDISTPLLKRLAIRNIMHTMQWYGNIQKHRNPLTAGNTNE